MTNAEAIQATMEKHAPEGYDPASDDMTIPFALKLAEQDAEIERLREALEHVAAGGPPAHPVTYPTKLAQANATIENFQQMAARALQQKEDGQ